MLLKNNIFIYLLFLLLIACQAKKKQHQEQVAHNNKESIEDTLAAWSALPPLPDNIGELYEICEAVNTQKEVTVSSLIKKPKPKKKKPDLFRKHATIFLESLKKQDIATASKYSADFGLKSFLNMEMDHISNFEIGACENDGYVGTAKVTLNHSIKHTFYFNRKGGKGNWRFIGIKNWRD